MEGPMNAFMTLRSCQPTGGAGSGGGGGGKFGVASVNVYRNTWLVPDPPAGDTP